MKYEGIRVMIPTSMTIYNFLHLFTSWAAQKRQSRPAHPSTAALILPQRDANSSITVKSLPRFKKEYIFYKLILGAAFPSSSRSVDPQSRFDDSGRRAGRLSPAWALLLVSETCHTPAWLVDTWLSVRFECGLEAYSDLVDNVGSILRVVFSEMLKLLGVWFEIDQLRNTCFCICPWYILQSCTDLFT